MEKEKLVDVLVYTRRILREYKLCDHCLGRMFAGRLAVVSHKRLGMRIRSALAQSRPPTCYICKNLMSTVDLQVKKMLAVSEGYEFSTFLIGAILQPSIQDRDDAIRSKFKLRGISSIKSDITREMGKKFSRKTRSVVDYKNPDMVFTVDFKNDYCEIKPKAILLQGRYVKHVRGLPQKQKSCDQCEGRGCFVCDFHGIREFASVEGKMAKFLLERFGAQQTKITWIGSEDESSLVLGNGRPFFVKVSSPHKRKVILAKKIDLEGVSLLDMRVINKIPREPVRFRTVVGMEVESDTELDGTQLEKLKHLKGRQVTLHENSRKHHKTIYRIGTKGIDGHSFRVIMESDGGMPLKRFVSGQEVEPSISSLLGSDCRCRQFDFKKIIVTN